MRVLGVDFGRRRIGLAISDVTGLLARPWSTIDAEPSPDASATTLAGFLRDRQRDPAEDVGELAAIVVGLPRRLSGDDTHDTAAVRKFADALARATGVAVHLQDERLTSHEAESRLAENERDWRRRKVKLDAAAAAIILQDFLDSHPRTPVE